MKLPAKAGGDFEIAPAGNHVAICNAIVDLGMQKGTAMYPAPKHQIYVRFELPGETVTYTKDGREMSGPMSIGRRFTASMSGKANLRKFVESWFGKPFPNDDAAADFDLKVLLGRKCLLNVTHNEKPGGKTYANIKDATPIPKGMPTDFAQHNQSIYFDITAPDNAAFERLPEWLQRIVHERLGDRPDEQKPAASNGAAAATADVDFDDDIPF
jgi:hypothetical protein